jgi:diguanylate cyclase (GGDEF)-like protein/PAS domain S-box-containing protein
MGEQPGWAQDRFRGLLESAPDAMVIVDPAGEVVLVNAQAERLFGYRREELLGQRVELLIPDRCRGRHVAHRTLYAADPHPRAMGAGLELYGLRKDGSEFPVEISLGPLEAGDGTLISSAIRDITERLEAEHAISHLAAVVESSDDAIISSTIDGTILSWNPGAERLYGYTADEVIGKQISLLAPPSRPDDATELLALVRAGERVQGHRTVRTHKDGTPIDVSLTISPIRDADGQVVGASAIARDIGDRLRNEQQLRYLAEHDALTGAHNRRRFEQDLGEQIARHRRYGERAALLILDINDFKKINDAYGHRTGDRALGAMANTIRKRLRETDTIARIGGDEFAVLLPYADAQQAARVAEDLRRVIGESAVEADGGTPVHITISVGVATVDTEARSDEQLFAEADRAMYEDKRRGSVP